MKTKHGITRSEEEIILEYREQIVDKLLEAEEIVTRYYKRKFGKVPTHPQWISYNQLIRDVYVEVVRHLLKR